MSVTVYTAPFCQQCDATTRLMDRLGIDYETVDVSQDPAALDFIRAEGFTQAPVVYAGEESWSGYNREKIREIAGMLAGEAVLAAA